MEKKNEQKIPDYVTMQNFLSPLMEQDASMLLIAKGDFAQLEKMLSAGMLYIDAAFLQQLVFFGHEDKVRGYLKHNEWISSAYQSLGEIMISSDARDIKRWLEAFLGCEEAQNFIFTEKIAKLLLFFETSLLAEKDEWQALADKEEWKILAEHQKFEYISAESDDGAAVLLGYGQDERVIAAKNWKAFLPFERGQKMLAELGLFEVLYSTKKATADNTSLFRLILDNGGADFLQKKREDKFLLEDARCPEPYVKAKEWLPLYKYEYYELIDWNDWYHKWCKSDYTGFIRLAVERHQWDILNKYFGPALYREELFKQCHFGRWLRSFF